MIEKVSAYVDRFRDWFETADDPGVDVDWLRKDRVPFLYIHIPESNSPARCQICGLQKPVKQLPSMLEHVADHDGQGAASVDPTMAQPSDGALLNNHTTKRRIHIPDDVDNPEDFDHTEHPDVTPEPVEVEVNDARHVGDTPDSDLDLFEIFD